jgi:hypothetical protein
VLARFVSFCSAGEACAGTATADAQRNNRFDHITSLPTVIRAGAHVMIYYHRTQSERIQAILLSTCTPLTLYPSFTQVLM